MNTKRYTLKVDVTSKKSGQKYTKGSVVSVAFSNDNEPARVTLTFVDGHSVNVKESNVYRFVEGFKKQPTIATMERWVSGCFAYTLTGYKVEPDGRGPDGSPSWLLVLGLI